MIGRLGEKASADRLLRSGVPADLVDLSATEVLPVSWHLRTLRSRTSRDHYGRRDRGQGRPGSLAPSGRTLAGRTPWYVIALGLPTILSLATAVLAYLAGTADFIRVGALAPIELVLFVLVVGEELGWRGYALPRLLEKRSALTASLILGVLWGLWHLPTFVVPGTPQYGLPWTAFVLLTIEYSILMTWVFLHTLGSVLIATLFHGALNLSQGIFLGTVEGATRYWLLCIVYGVATLIAAIALARSGSRKSQAPTRSQVPDSTTS